MKKLMAFMMTAAMVMGLSVPVFAADFGKYEINVRYNDLTFDAAYAETKLVNINDNPDEGGPGTKQSITLITVKAGSNLNIEPVPGNDPFMNCLGYTDYSKNGVYTITPEAFILFPGSADLNFAAEDNTMIRLDNGIFVRMEGTNAALDAPGANVKPIVKPEEPATPAAPAKPAAPAAQKATAAPTNSKVLVDGKVVAFDAYNINGNNYFKLRDVAQVVSGSAKQFAVTWDGSKNSINLVSGEAYASVGTELAKGDGKAKAATLNTAAIYKDGAEADLTAYTINGNNYFKLRDLGQAFDFNVAWDGANNCIMIDTATSYVR